MNQQDDSVELIRGRWYRYDADFDAYYPITAPESTVSKLAWIAAAAFLTIVCYIVSV